MVSTTVAAFSRHVPLIKFLGKRIIGPQSQSTTPWIPPASSAPNTHPLPSLQLRAISRRFQRTLLTAEEIECIMMGGASANVTKAPFTSIKSADKKERK